MSERRCVNGHPWERMPSGGCRPCRRESEARFHARKRAGVVLPKPKARKCGHPWSDHMPTKPSNCLTCNRLRAGAYAAAKRGGPPRQINPERFPCGHSRLTDARPTKTSTCAVCHKAREQARYRADPITHRAKALAYQKANREGANARSRAFRARNPGYDSARRYAPDAETRAWLDIIAADPCSYCGGSSNAVDHILAVSRGGANHWSNFAPTCRPCNSSKRDRSLLPWLLAFRSEIPA